MKIRKIIKNVRKGIAGLALAGIISGCHSVNSTNTIMPFGKAEVYHDTRGMPTATLTGGAKNLPLGTALFGFTDIETEKENKDNLKRPYAEIRFSKKAENGLGLAIEHNRDFALPRGVTRLGAIYEPDLSELNKNLNLGLKFYPAANQDKGSQLGIYGKKDFKDREYYLGGFFDYNFKPKRIVTDIQFGKRIGENLYFIVEWRHNGFYKKDKSGAGIGLEYRF